MQHSRKNTLGHWDSGTLAFNTYSNRYPQAEHSARGNCAAMAQAAPPAPLLTLNWN